MKRLSLVFVVALAVGAYWWLHRDGLDQTEAEPSVAPSSIGVSATQQPPSENADVEPAASSRTSDEASSMRSSTSQYPPEYFLEARQDRGFRENPDIPLPTLPPPDENKRHPSELEARTPEEAVWLDRHGYPTQEELDALDTLRDAELAERASKGDLSAMAMLGKKQLQRRDSVSAGYDNLSEAALLGSVWALLVLADEQERIRNYGDAFALYNLAALRGDWLSPALHMNSMPRELTPLSYLSVPEQTAQHFATLQYQRQQRGLPPLVNTMRPNIFNRPGGSEPIGVYRRSRK